MKVKIKVLVNGEAIKAAEETNRRNAQLRFQQNGKPKKMQVVYEDVEVPAQVIEERDLYLDLDKIQYATENEHGMISIMYNGRDGIYLVKTAELMAQLERRFGSDCCDSCKSGNKCLIDKASTN